MATSKTNAPDQSEFGLPGASFARLKDILRAYGSRDGEMAMAEVAVMLDTDASSISRNSRFLLGAGLLSGGVKRKLTERGRRLFDAMAVEDDVSGRACWREIVAETRFLQDRLTTLRLKGPMERGRFVEFILSAPGVRTTAASRAGARAIVDIMIESGVAREDGGSLSAVPEDELTHSVASSSSSSPADTSATAQRSRSSGEVPAPVPSEAKQSTVASASVLSTVAINIELHIPATNDDEIYQKLFRALRQELLGRGAE